MDGKLDGQTCTAATDCLPGSTCVTSGGQSKCREYCDLDGPNNQCAPGLTCGPFTQDVNVNDVDLGSCR
jgi:hypothetical protein